MAAPLPFLKSAGKDTRPQQPRVESQSRRPSASRRLTSAYIYNLFSFFPPFLPSLLICLSLCFAFYKCLLIFRYLLLDQAVRALRELTCILVACQNQWHSWTWSLSFLSVGISLLQEFYMTKRQVPHFEISIIPLYEWLLPHMPWYIRSILGAVPTFSVFLLGTSLQEIFSLVYFYFFPKFFCYHFPF